MSFLNNLGFGNTSPLDLLNSVQNNVFGTANNAISGASNTASSLVGGVTSSISSITDIFGSLIKFIPYVLLGLAGYLLLTLMKK